MRNFWICFGLAVVLLCLPGCSGSEDAADAGGRIPLEVSQQSFNWDSDVNGQAVSIITSSEWTAKTNVEWCKPRKESGRGSYNLSLWVSPNITPAARSGVLTIKAGSETKAISISQPAYTADTTYVYRLPVIFHVLYKSSNDVKQNIPQEWLAEVLDSVNAGYRRNGMGIEFCMAQIDQNGDTLTEAGVMRHHVDFTTMDSDYFLSSGNTKYGNLNQNFQRYINIFTFTFKDENVMGVTTLPNMPSTRKLDGLSYMSGKDLQSVKTLDFPWGVAINNNYVYDSQPSGYIVPTYIVTTLSHELGHYLGLLHTFSEDKCNEDDYCEDTKNCDYNAYLDELERFLKEIASSGSGDLDVRMILRRFNCEDGEEYYADNILDYMYTIGDKLTPNQQVRTRRVLNYCPMVPGPKLETYSTAGSRSDSGGAAFVIPRLSNCPGMPLKEKPSFHREVPVK